MDETLSIERPLGAGETILWAADALCPIHFTTFVTVRGPLDPALLREALDQVQRRHPPLRVRIRPEDRALWFREVDAEIPLTVRHAGEEAIEGALAEACLERIDPARDPLLRATLLVHGADRSTLLLRFHHAIGDGKSGAFLARDVLEVCNRRLRDGAGFVPLPALAPTPSLETLFDLERVSWGALARHGGAMLDVALDLARRAPILTLPLDAAAPVERRSLTVVRHVWSASETTRLGARAKREGTTVHGALLTGLTLATLTAAGHGGPRGVLLGSPVDVRARGRADVGEALGFYVSMLGSVHTVDHATYFWRLAREVRAALVAGLEQDQHVHFVPPQFAMLARSARTQPRRTLELVARFGPPATAGITNIGRMDLGQAGAIRIEHGGFAANPSFLGECASTATTLGGRLVWTICTQPPVVPRARAEALLAEARDRVLAACRSR